MTPVWYVAYGSNLLADRLGYYLRGGTPPGGARRYPGCRDPSPPARDRPVTLAGGVYFALESRAWGGGLALYDPHLPGATPARAYLLGRDQFSDLVRQEMYQPPGADLDLEGVLTTGRQAYGPGRYETVLRTGVLDGAPMLTFTAGWSAADVEWTAPSATYLSMLGRGLAESHGWPTARIAAYLAGLPGARGRWTQDGVRTLLD